MNPLALVGRTPAWRERLSNLPHTPPTTRIASATSVIRVRAEDAERSDVHGDVLTRIELAANRLEVLAALLEEKVA